MTEATKQQLSEKIFIALGEASMCWSERPKGIFESTRAAEIGTKLLNDVERIIQAGSWDDRQSLPPKK